MPELQGGDAIEFVRKRDYVFVKEMGQGACGKTVLLRDDVIDEHFVCKKYSPIYEEYKDELFSNFIREIKLLHGVYHENVVRVFNYHLYPEKKTGFILMEYINGEELDKFIAQSPDTLEDIFLQAINGFCHLEVKNILHRDIRPGNLMITSDQTLKIIDFGFGKHIAASADFGKSISLNWWCDTPQEFSSDQYDFSTEVYFVGKLFEKTLQNLSISTFKYKSVLRKMCEYSPESRYPKFSDIQRDILSEKFEEIEFWGNESYNYRRFADEMTSHVTRIQSGARYADDPDKIIAQLTVAYRKTMLENELPDCAPVLAAFIDGSFRYIKSKFSVSALKDFIDLLKAVGKEKQRIILANLQSRFDAIPRYEPKVVDIDDDIPF